MREYRRPFSKLPGNCALPLLLQKICGFEDGGHDITQASYHILNATDMILDVLEERSCSVVDAGQFEVNELAGNLRQGKPRLFYGLDVPPHQYIVRNHVLEGIILENA